ncbi:FMN-binding negative transcriptional regulator [Sphingomonas profundi]|uniref:FMN-binding negative transcriptional regulator n=1 Tax=Alterirhizorhabdus profundi TaxID=2681549 RepID=UPI0012E88AEB|nr:FMN-binding negative transcriptional regulator [Sphingomonas profundi]
MSFAPRSPADIVALIGAHPLAWVISRDFDATPLPLLAECDADGRLVSLFGHYARRNPQVAAFERDPAALILFSGPQGYVSPTLVAKPHWGATWNYAAVRVTAEMAFVPAETDASVRRLAAHLEPEGGWRVEAMGARYDQLARQIIAFRATVTGCEATFKLGQDEDEDTFAQIVRDHPDRALARAMQDQAP